MAFIRIKDTNIAARKPVTGRLIRRYRNNILHSQIAMPEGVGDMGQIVGVQADFVIATLRVMVRRQFQNANGRTRIEVPLDATGTGDAGSSSVFIRNGDDVSGNLDTTVPGSASAVLVLTFSSTAEQINEIELVGTSTGNSGLPTPTRTDFDMDDRVLMYAAPLTE